ncbi:MAG TPA: hypothetical protein VD833_26960 [Vicinamibacterales bacterium]|nr:hypothetical protein [Vicinamibacterales bacterium]
MSTPATQATDALATYLNDHLSGAVAALRMLDHLIGHAGVPADGAFFTRLRHDISDDRQTLEELLKKTGGRTSTVRQIGGWMAEWAGNLKLYVDDPSRGSLARLEALEFLALGIQGKLALWRALAAAALPAFHGTDFETLVERARDQHERVEIRRIESARRVLST